MVAHDDSVTGAAVAIPRYCLIHLALSLHLLLVSVIDLRRVDSWMLLLPHQLLSAGLLGMCYATNFVRLGARCQSASQPLQGSALRSACAAAAWSLSERAACHQHSLAGISITVLHDCADMIRSLAKCCHYLGLHPWDDLLFVLLFLAWVSRRRAGALP